MASSSKSGTKDLWQIIAERRAAADSASAAEPASSSSAPAPPQSSDKETNVIVVGNKSSGKTTLIQRFIKKDDVTPKPTVALEYTYGRKEVGSTTQTAHFWELGGGSSLIDLVDTLITAETISTVVIVIVVDLSEPHTGFDTLYTWIGRIKQRVRDVIKSLDAAASPIPAKLLKKMTKRFGEDHPDIQRVEISPVPMIILANKYDTFANAEAEERKIMFRTLRHIAHTNSASLLCTNNKDEAMVAKYRSIMSSLVFGGPLNDKAQADHSKPISLMAGKDSITAIGNPPTLATPASSKLTVQYSLTPSLWGDFSLDKWQQALATVFPPPPKAVAEKDIFENFESAFKEPPVDSMRAQKDVEFAALRKAAADFSKGLNLPS